MKMCDLCVKKEVMPQTDKVNQALDVLFTDVLNDWAVQEIVNKFANMEVCAICFFKGVAEAVEVEEAE